MYEQHSTLYKDWQKLNSVVARLAAGSSSFDSLLLSRSESLLEHLYFLLEHDFQGESENQVRRIKTGLLFLCENIPLYYHDQKLVAEFQDCSRQLLSHLEHSTAKRKKILILYISNQHGHGSGHQMAAFAVRDGLLASFGKDYEVELLDLVDAASTTLHALTGIAYDAMVKKQPEVWKWLFQNTSKSSQIKMINRLSYPIMSKEVGKIFKKIQPDIIVSTFPLWDYIIHKMNQRHEKKIPYVSVITDSISIHQLWMNEFVDHFVVANQDTAEVLKQNDIPASKIHPLGFPLRVDFYDNPDGNAFRKKINVPADKKIILNIIGTGASKKDLEPALYLDQHLDDAKCTQLLLFGNNRELFEWFQRKYRSLRLSRAFGWSNKMPEFLGAADLLITKAGGAIVMEAVQKQLPAIITRVIPGQEEGNLTLLKKYDVGTLATSREEIYRAVEDMFRDKRLDRMKRNFEPIRTDRASFTIAQFIKDIVET